MNDKQREIWERYSRIMRWGRAHPTEFCERFLGLELLDMQKYALINTWYRECAVWLMSRNAGKTTLLAVYTMLRSLLFPNHASYFLGNTGDQAKEVFKKIEKIAKKEIDSFAGCTDFFMYELQKSGFTHNPNSFTFSLFNGSTVNTLNSDVVNIKGRRANLVCFDEAGWFSDELFIQAENFVNQDENFRLGGKADMTTEPKGFPRQLLYASSASDTSSEFYKKFKSYAHSMIMGDTRYFVCSFTADAVMSAKFRGEPYPPLISRDKVEKALSDNHEKALRELYNKFSSGVHEGQLLTRREIMQHTRCVPPLLYNDTGNKSFIFSWDCARLGDNSVICIARLIDDPKTGYRMELCNVVSLTDTDTRKKTPKRFPDQVKDFKRLLLQYNGTMFGKRDYENIRAVVCDSGAGGQMIGGVCDYLVEDWRDERGKLHKGLIDRSHKANETVKNRYPNAVDIIRLIDPKGTRAAIFEALESVIRSGLLTFPADYTGSDHLSLPEGGRYPLTPEERLSLAQIELTKNETITMCRFDNQGSITYGYPPDKRNTMHDDRVFALGLLCYYLAALRHSQLTEPKKTSRRTLSGLCRAAKLEE